MTTTHVDFDSNNPQGSQAPDAYATSDLNNLRSLRDMIIAGLVPGFVQTRTQGTGPDVQRPQFITWNNGALNIGFRWKITWTGFNPTTVQEEWQNDGVPTWVAVGSAQVNTFDANNNITASTNSGGFVNMVFELWGKLGKAISDLATHIAATGMAVHGLASMAIQSASAVAITGGAMDGVNVGDTTRARGSFTRVAEESTAYAPGAGAGVTVDWSKGGSFITTSGTNAVTFTGLPASGILGGHMLETNNFNALTFPAAVDFGLGGKPSIAGAASAVLATRDGGTSIKASIYWRAV